MLMKGILLLGAMALCLAAPVGAEPAREVAQLTNQLRAQHGLHPLRVSVSLESAAEMHGADMAHNRFFSHTGSDGSEVSHRASRAGYGWCVIAENIAKGHRSPRAVTRGWMNSPGHRQNMLDYSVTDIGIIRRGQLWVMVLGQSGC